MPKLARSAWRQIRRAQAHLRFPGSAEYWENRYADGGTSGSGSVGESARFKADVVNRIVVENDISTVVEIGCGDGDQLELLEVPSYLGVDVSPTVVEACRSRFSGRRDRRFIVSGDGPIPTCDLALAMDVMLHLVEDDVFESYVRTLFGSASRFVGIYDVDQDARPGWPHVRYRNFSRWIAEHVEDWEMVDMLVNDMGCSDGFNKPAFFIYERERL